MSDYKPYTDEERGQLCQNVQEVLDYFDPAVSNLEDSNLYAARIAARYEATLQAKDAQIEMLVGLVQELRDCVMDDGLPCNCGTLRDGSQYECIQCRSYTAIKEATCS